MSVFFLNIKNHFSASHQSLNSTASLLILPCCSFALHPAIKACLMPFGSDGLKSRRTVLNRGFSSNSVFEIAGLRSSSNLFASGSLNG